MDTLPEVMPNPLHLHTVMCLAMPTTLGVHQLYLLPTLANHITLTQTSHWKKYCAPSVYIYITSGTSEIPQF